jgi:hypothetical protein
MAPHSAVLPNEPVAISQSPIEPHTIAANTPVANKNERPPVSYFLPAVGWFRDRQPASKATKFADRQFDKAENGGPFPSAI